MVINCGGGGSYGDVPLTLKIVLSAILFFLSIGVFATVRYLLNALYRWRS